MTESSLHATITALAEPLAAGLGLGLWGVEIAFGGRSVVRIFVEGEDGVDVDQCADLSRLLALSLEVEDCIPGPYVLEVSSPGLERVFFTPEQLRRAVGETVEITLHAPLAALPGRRRLRGVLTAVPDPGQVVPFPPADDGEQDGRFALRVREVAGPGEDDPVVEFCFADAKKIRQVHVVPEKTLPGKGPKKSSGAGKGKKPAGKTGAGTPDDSAAKGIVAANGTGPIPAGESGALPVGSGAGPAGNRKENL